MIQTEKSWPDAIKRFRDLIEQKADATQPTDALNQPLLYGKHQAYHESLRMVDELLHGYGRFAK